MRNLYYYLKNKNVEYHLTRFHQAIDYRGHPNFPLTDIHNRMI